MAMSNSIGSNVFDILICLGVPWFLENTIVKPFSIIKVYSGGIFYSAGVLLCSIVVQRLFFFFLFCRLASPFNVAQITVVKRKKEKK